MTGTYEFTFEENFKFGKNLITEELEHGLGKGPVFIHIGLEEKYDDYNDDENAIFYGDSEVFFKTEDEPQASMYTFGSVVYPKKGSFKIGMRVKNGKDGERIRLRWWAYKSMADINQKDRINIKIDPSEVELRKGEEYNFKAIITGDDTYNYRWEIEDESFGVLDEHGKLLADDTTGTFKIFAISNVDPTVRGTAFVTIYDDDAFNGLNDQVSGLGGFGVDEG